MRVDRSAGDALTLLGWREAVALFLAATAWFLPGIWWGLPVDTPDALMRGWGVDELAPFGATSAVKALFGAPVQLSPQYPLGHYLVQAVFVWPYHLAVLAADNLGFPTQEPSTRVLTLLHRLPSILMAAGAVVAAAAFVRQVTGSRSASWFTAVTVATIGPLTYYARTSNVDAAGLFWAAVALVPAATAVREGLTIRRAVLLGLCAAMGIATKDQQYAFFLGLGLVVLAAHVRQAGRSPVPEGRWKAPLVGFAVATGAFLLLSGAALLPRWFMGHVEFIRRGSSPDVPEQLRGLVGFYFSNPATLAGYWRVGVETLAQVLAAVGVPVLLLAVIGAAILFRRDARLLMLLTAPAMGLVAGVILPVRFVLPRFLMPIELLLCLLAGIALEAASRSQQWRRVARGVALAGMAWGVLRGGDLAWQMQRDSRHEAARWLADNLQPGDTLGYYGARLKLPRLRRGVLATPAPDQYVTTLYPGGVPLTPTPQFILVIPQQGTEPMHEWTVPDTVFQGLMDGTRGYQQVLAIQAGALFPRPLRVAPAVNPPVRVFARRDMLRRLPGPVRLELPYRASAEPAR